MNYWKQFAEMLGLELGEKFVLADDDGERRDKDTYKITKVGVYHRSVNTDAYLLETPTTLYHLLCGHYKAIPVPWKPEQGKAFWYYSKIWDQAFSCEWKCTLSDLVFWKAGNCFETREKAETKGKELMKQLMKEFKEE